MKEKMKMAYEVPLLTVVSFTIEQGFVASGSSSISGMFGLGRSWSNDDGDAWSGDNSGGGGNRFGGWIDNGGSAWE